MSVKALDRMIDAANKSGKLFTVHQNRRWDVDFLGMKKSLKTVTSARLSILSLVFTVLAVFLPTGVATSLTVAA